jgi:integrase
LRIGELLALRWRDVDIANGVLRVRAGERGAWSFSLRMGFPIAFAEVLPVASIVAVQPIHYKGICPEPAHLFIDVLTKVGYVKYATSIVQVCIHQIFSEAFEQG